MGDTQKTDIRDSSVSGGSISATQGSTINYLDSNVAMAALETATNLGKASLSQSGDFVTGVLQLADKQSAQVEAARVGNNNLAKDLAETAISKVQQSGQSDSVQTVGALTSKTGAIVAIVALLGLLFFFNKGKKS